MNSLLRAAAVALCTIVLAGVTAPAQAQNYPMVCCSYKDASGALRFFMAPATQCPRDKVAATERCKSERVCCLSNNGYYWDSSAERCKASGSTVEDSRYCERPNDAICCKGRNGFVKTTPNRCITLEQGRPVADRYCARATPICCKTRSGVQFLQPDRCKAAGGSKIPNRECDKPVCCRLSTGQFRMEPAVECRKPFGTPVSSQRCKPRTVCCRTPNGYYSWTPAMCKKARGTVVNARYCKQQVRKSCCKYTKADGNVAYGFLDPRRCKSLKGSRVSNKYCLKATDRLRLRRN